MHEHLHKHHDAKVFHYCKLVMKDGCNEDITKEDGGHFSMAGLVSP